MMKIIITGTSRGIGNSIANYLSNKHEVIGLSRSKNKTSNNFKTFQYYLNIKSYLVSKNLMFSINLQE